ncbi:hypothetical protein [Metabacillus iocasae]|uniref:Uncharacterized protein n=1 Tax=Priestia iocasae TaxID=2291674 RepID=A0ABS2QPG7_9BACI|nr:hypothetical protein [Metabacillus iocasae]MBM7701350.1 hypothetical protein [Metabacillus iocasae]
MTTFIFIGISSIVLFLVLYFLPLPYNKTGKIVIFSAAVLLSIIGLLANTILPIHTMLLIILLLLICCSYVLSKRLEVVGVKEEQMDSYYHSNVSEEKSDVEEEFSIGPAVPTLTLEKQSINNESPQLDDELIQHVMTKEEMDELFDHRSMNSEAVEHDSSTLENDQEEIPSLEEELDFVTPHYEEGEAPHLEEVDEDILTIDTIDSPLVMDIVVEEEVFVHPQVTEQEEVDEHVAEIAPVDDALPIMDELEESLLQVKDAVEDIEEDDFEDIQQLDEHDVLDGTEEIQVETEEVDENATKEMAEQVEEHFDVDELEAIEAAEKDALSTMLEQVEEKQENVNHASDEVEVLPEISTSNQKEHIEQLVNDSYNGKSEQEIMNFDEITIDETPELTEQEESELVTPAPIMNTAVWQTIIEQVNVYKQLLSKDEYERLLKDYLLAPLPREEYYVLAVMLVQHYIETSQRAEALNEIHVLQETYSDYPVLIAELQYLQEVANNN